MGMFVNEILKIIEDFREKNHRLELENNYFRSALKEKDQLIMNLKESNVSLRTELKAMDDFVLGKNRGKIPVDALFYKV